MSEKESTKDTASAEPRATVVPALAGEKLSGGAVSSEAKLQPAPQKEKLRKKSAAKANKADALQESSTAEAKPKAARAPAKKKRKPMVEDRERKPRSKAREEDYRSKGSDATTPSDERPAKREHQGRQPRSKKQSSQKRGNQQRSQSQGQQQQHPQGDAEEGHEGGQRNRRRRKGKKPEVPLGPPEAAEGLFEISPKGFGFIRLREKNFKQTPGDIFVTPETVREYGLRQGLWLEGEAQSGNRGPQLTSLTKINGHTPDRYRHLPAFEELKAINPNKRILLETQSTRKTTRVIDMMAPIGRGQRGLIVAPPRTGKTTLLQHIAEAVIEKHDDIKLIVLLVDERPEEVTEFRRNLPEAEIFASSNDSDTKTHTRIAQLCIDRAKRLVEAGEHVFILLDSITRLARAFNNSMRSGGRTGSGGLDTRAMEIPRRIFASARNTREGGSLTIVATALIETGSRMDDVIFQEFKGTGNMELVLDRHISQNYVYPAVDIFKSGTRREELLLPPHQLEKIYVIRRGLSGHKPIEAIERLLSFCDKFPNNAQMLLEIPG